jgi:hypothetical protein
MSIFDNFLWPFTVNFSRNHGFVATFYLNCQIFDHFSSQLSIFWPLFFSLVNFVATFYPNFQFFSILYDLLFSFPLPISKQNKRRF